MLSHVSCSILNAGFRKMKDSSTLNSVSPIAQFALLGPITIFILMKQLSCLSRSGISIMVGFAPAVLAMALNLDGVHIFKEPKATFTGPYLSYYIFMLAIFVVLTHVNLYPSYFRKLCWCGNTLIEFLCAQFTFEYSVHDFWFPVDETVTYIVTNSIENTDQWEEMECMKQVIEALKSENTGIICSYLLSCFFLCAALHATRIIDLRMLQHFFNSWQDLIKQAEHSLASVLKILYAMKFNGKTKKQKSKCNEHGSKKKKVEDSEDDSGNWEPPKKHGRRRH